MNERIKRLVKEAGLDDPVCPIDEWENLELNKFAELIVQECVAVVDAARSGVNGIPAEAALHIASKNIKAYFGVE